MRIPEALSKFWTVAFLRYNENRNLHSYHNSYPARIERISAFGEFMLREMLLKFEFLIYILLFSYWSIFYCSSEIFYKNVKAIKTSSIFRM